MSDKQPRVSCVLVHGWGMNHTVWQPLLDKLPDWIDVELMDLPGHGQRFNESFTDLQNLIDDVAEFCQAVKKNNQPLVLVGWSLGGLPCVQVAIEKPQSVDALMLVSSNPCFVTQSDWSYGVDAQVFEQFAESLKADFSGTIRRFLSLQVKGSESGRIILRNLREKILQQAQPNETSLDAGLDVLKQADLRNQLAGISQPVCWALGEQDGLVSAKLANALKQIMGQAEVQVYSKAGHAPFLSHTDEFVLQLVEFINAKVLTPNSIN
jgi:pimeloyl-[acyl-carrier protein] methyl ester esterase